MWWNDYVGLPFKAKGRDRSGVDCWGLVRLVFMEQIGITLPSYLDYDDPHNSAEVGALVAQYRHLWREIPISHAQSFDVVLMRPCHIGVVTRPGMMLHIMSGINAAIESYTGPVWKLRVEGYFRHAKR